MESIISSYNLKILDGNKVVEIMTTEIGKGKAVKKLVEENNYDYILSIGDDKTDEEMFEFFYIILMLLLLKLETAPPLQNINLTM